MGQIGIKKLETDIQTRNDLCVTQNPYGEFELTSIYNETQSIGGHRLLKNWVTYPISDMRVLHNRIESIRVGGIADLKIDGDSLDFIEYYLNYDEPPPITTLEVISYYQWLKNKFQNNPWNYIKKRGCLYLCELIRELRKISSAEYEAGQPNAVRRTIRMIRSYMESSTFVSIPDKETACSCYETDQLDYIFRNKGKVAVQGILDIVYEQDAFQSAHKIACEKGYCYPELYSDSSRLVIHDFFHPALPKAVPNSWNLEEKHINIFTGSNMAGKSTTLKALSSAIWLAHAGVPVPASRMLCPVYNGLFTSINLPDSLKKRESHFYAEVLRIKSILEKVRDGNGYFIVFDELFRGTNARDAYEASEIVLGLLNKHTKSKFLLSTHIIELAETFYNEKTCQFNYMESEIKDDRFICSYKLKEGISESRIGSWLVKKELTID
ncbi:MutS-related protein [Parabacteroides faecis]|uniref:DNA mismatch repair ATPase MutS n=1 Tax=Parabacteroides faecis TaxID=1217282 RepID=A0ABR6KI17_9BACT|nr:hypothetical protein [Parabacteroides faecis]MBB4621153.1 DNA mismatch repair ATPase MutS [Parabacteroides faecis]GGJ88755.1 DNA mismatch repair protein MutS [Parabacteroides faecis]